MKKGKINGTVVLYFLLAAVLILGIRYFEVLLGSAGSLWQIAFPLIMGCIIAYVLNIVLKKLEKIWFPHSKNKLVIKTRRMTCMVLSILLIVAVFAMVLLLVVPELVKAFVLIGREIPVFFEQLMDWLVANAKIYPDVAKELQNLTIDWNGLADSLWNYLKAGVGGILNSTVTLVGSLVGAVINFVIALIFALYILSSKEKLGSQIKRTVRAFVKPEWIEKGKTIVRTADETFSSFIVGQCTEAVILGTLCTLGMLLFRFPYAPMIGAFIGATALIPVVGAYLGGGIGAFMILMQDPWKAVLFIVFLVVLQQLEGNLIYPKVVGSSIGLPGMWVLAAVTIGGGLLGVYGMLIGVPTAATVYKLLGRSVRARTAAGGTAGKAVKSTDCTDGQK